MSESLGNTEPTNATKPDSSLEDTQEHIQTTPSSDENTSQMSTMVSPKNTDSLDETQAGTPLTPKKPKNKLGGRIGRFLLNVLIFLLIIGLGVFGGYQSGINIRQRAQESLVTQQLSDQFSRALVDIQFGNYDAAKTRLEYIIGIDPSYPGAMDKLTEVMVLSTVPTATPVVSPTPELIVVDETDYNGMFAQAQQLIAAQQWQNAITVLSTLRRKDATFNAVQVDGMYYFALRNLGVEQIQAGNFLQENARAFLNAASFWDLDWERAAIQFAQLNGSGLWDGTMTATERYRIAATRYADQLFAQGRYCEADEQYNNAQTAGPLDEASAGQAHQAHLACYPPTATPAPVVTAEPTATTDSSYPNP